MQKTKTDIVVVGAGPGGYAAAFYGRDKGKKITLIDKSERLGGVCLNHGCIPSKALLHATKLIKEAKESGFRGIHFGEPKINLDEMRTWKNGILRKLESGIRQLAKKREVEVINGRGYFEDSKTIRVETNAGQQFIEFDKAIIAVGSKPTLPKTFDLGNPRIMTSTEALEIEEIPENILIVGGGYIGMELGTVYSTLGSQVVVVEALNSILMGADADLVRYVMMYAKKNFKEVRLNTEVEKLATSGKKIKVTFKKNGETFDEIFDRVLVSIGRKPNDDDLGLENTHVTLDERKFITVNEKQQTRDQNIYAIGDIVGGMMLAHKASREARIAIEAITGENSPHTNIIPAVVFTDPEIAWAGLTEDEAKQKNIQISVARFPWGASGRALTFDRTDGMTKLIIEPETERILGVGIAGHGAGELIAEGVVAIEMGATAYDLAHSIHPHPTLSETLMECAEAFYGHATHVAK